MWEAVFGAIKWVFTLGATSRKEVRADFSTQIEARDGMIDKMLSRLDSYEKRQDAHDEEIVGIHNKLVECVKSHNECEENLMAERTARRQLEDRVGRLELRVIRQPPA